MSKMSPGLVFGQVGFSNLSSWFGLRRQNDSIRGWFEEEVIDNWSRIHDPKLSCKKVMETFD